MRNVYIFIVLMFLIVLNSYSENRVALIIGNGEYKSSPLNNPVNDADDMASTLENLGFEVLLETNSSKKEMLTAIRKFGEKLTPESVGLFYYAGHGVQLDSSNYLIPVGADIQSSADIEFEGVALDRLIRVMENSKTYKSLIFLDACRDNPYASSSRSGTRGLSIVSRKSTGKSAGTLIAFATSPGSVADDGDGDNGIFTSALIKYIKEPGLEIQQLMTKVRSEVMEDTNGKQQPWTNVSLTEEFYFQGGELNNIGTGVLNVEVYEKAAVYIDGKFFEIVEDDSIISLSNITSGSRVIEFKYPEYTDKQIVNVIRNKTTSVRSLYESNPIFNLNITIPEAKNITVYANDELLGEAPIAKELPVGEYLISFKAPHIENKELVIEPASRDIIDLVIDDVKYKYGDAVIEGLPKGTKVKFNSDVQNKTITTDDTINRVNDLLVGEVNVYFEHKSIQNFNVTINVDEYKTVSINPEYTTVGLLNLVNNNNLPTLVKLEPIGSFREGTTFPELDFNINSNGSYNIDLPVGKYKVSYYKPKDKVPGIEEELFISVDSPLESKIKKFDYSISYQLDEKYKVRTELNNDLSITKKKRFKKSTGGWVFLLGGLGSLGYGGYSYTQLDSAYDNYNNALTSSSAGKYRGDVEDLQMTVSISAIAGGLSLLIGSIMNATLPEYKSTEEQLKQVEFDITLLESKLEK